MNDHKSQATIKDLLDNFNNDFLGSTSVYRSDLIDRDPDQILLTEFFADSKFKFTISRFEDNLIEKSNSNFIYTKLKVNPPKFNSIPIDLNYKSISFNDKSSKFLNNLIICFQIILSLVGLNVLYCKLNEKIKED